MKGRLNEEEHRVDALALRAEERRDKLRKAAGRSKYPLIRRFLNGGTRRSKPPSPIHESIVYGREPGELKHLSSRRKRKKKHFSKEKSILKVAASEMEGAQTGARAPRGLGPHKLVAESAEWPWEGQPERVKAP